MKLLVLMALAFSFAAQARITNFRQVELKSVTCEAAHRGKLTVLGAEWSSKNNVLTIYQTETEGGEVAYATDYEVYKAFAMSQTYMMLGRPIDGSDGHVQFMLRDERPTTISINAKGVSYASCAIEADEL